MNFLRQCGLLCLALLAFAVAPVFAQPEGADSSRRYVEFPIAGDVKTLLEQRLAMEKQLGPLKELIKQIAVDPLKFPINEEKIKEMKLSDPEFKKAITDWIGSDPQLKKSLKDWLEQNKARQKPAEMKELQEILDKPAPPAETPKPGPLEPAQADPLAKVAEKAMKHAQDSTLGDWLRESPAWQRALQDVHSSLANPKASTWKLGEWTDRLRLTNPTTWEFGSELTKRLRNLPQPNLSRWNWSESLPNFGRLPSPNLAAPSVPGPSLPSLGASATWLLLGLLCLLVGAQTLRWTKRAAAREDVKVQLGPWPVRPEAVATRAELVQAFDYLAVLTFGGAVKTWNHHAIARQWHDKAAACAAAARALANLYEQARYTEGTAELAPAARDLARRSLLQLAEAL